MYGVKFFDELEDCNNLEESQIVGNLTRYLFSLLLTGVTALASAAMFGEAYVVRYLLEHGADPNKTDETGSVALHFAAKNGLSLHVYYYYFFIL